MIGLSHHPQQMIRSTRPPTQQPSTSLPSISSFERQWYYTLPHMSFINTDRVSQVVCRAILLQHFDQYQGPLGVPSNLGSLEIRFRKIFAGKYAEFCLVMRHC